ncbi:uncharacterized protein METZ01_LOCUS318057 [marine metagenome]|uniref:Uncharacterized protein n=1 Tax=marine metagenome TaxID=408172 RepID=A0A382NVL2_9ZZZZ
MLQLEYEQDGHVLLALRAMHNS